MFSKLRESTKNSRDNFLVWKYKCRYCVRDDFHTQVMYSNRNESTKFIFVITNQHIIQRSFLKKFGKVKNMEHLT